MWFALVLLGLVLLTISGLYVRRRLGESLTQLGVSARAIRIVRWAMGWLMWGFPGLLFLTVLIATLLKWSRIPRYDGLWPALVLGLPFVFTVLVVFQSVVWILAIDLATVISRSRINPRARAIAVLVAIGAFILYTPIRVLAERGAVDMRHYRVGTSSAPPLRIAFLADIQQDVFTDGDRAKEIFARVNAEHPDIVLSGGDWINTGTDYIESAAAAAETLHSRLGTFSVRGDHEHFAYRDRDRSIAEVTRAMHDHHVEILSNEIRWFEHDGKRIAILFLNYNYIVRTDRAHIDDLVGQLAKADYSIVVTHQFDAKLASDLEGKVDLVLGAHTHGGQVNPMVGLVHISLARLETPFVDGRYALGARTTVIVTSGIGYSIVPIRYAAPGSIEIVDLAP
jgi:predicted MPP superfamily phosphohydrolase